MRVCVCNDITVDAVRDRVQQTGETDPAVIFRLLGKRVQCGNCRSLVHSIAELSLKQGKRKT